MHRTTALVLAAGLCLLAAPASGQVPPTPSRDEWFAENDTGHWSDGTRVRIDEGCLGLPEADAARCSLQAFKERPFVVMAIVDSGLNVYHQDFRAPEFTHHPSTFIEGFPTDAAAVNLSFDVADAEGYDQARAADEDAWFELERNSLYWFPGTRVIGGISIANGGTGAGRTDFKVLDENGHGTGTASVAAGQFYGANPNTLIVEVEGLGTNSVNWAANQPWIDIVSNSWGPGLPGRVDPLGNADAWRDSARRGQTTLFSAGNGMYNTNSSTVFSPQVPVEDPCKCKIPGHNVSMTSYTSGPSWVITVGAISPINGQAHWWHGIPVDAASFGSKWKAADAFGITTEENREFGGTSCATPMTGGVLSAVIEKAREVLGDNVAGQKPDGVAAIAPSAVTLPSSGPLMDGMLTRSEAETIVLKTAQPVPFDPEKYTWDYAVEPTTDTYYVNQGYGVVDRRSKETALQVLLGETPMPDRADVDAWIAYTDSIKWTIYGAP
jgi:hypothetical protein